MEAQIQMMEERFAQKKRNTEVMSQNGSNSQRVVYTTITIHQLVVQPLNTLCRFISLYLLFCLQSPRSVEHVHEAYHDAHFQEDEAYEDNESNDAIGVGENLLVDRRTAAPTMQSPSNAALVMQPHPLNAALTIRR